MNKQTTTTKTQLRVRTQVRGGEYCPKTCFNQFVARMDELSFDENDKEFKKCVCSCHDPYFDKEYKCSALRS